MSSVNNYYVVLDCLPGIAMLPKDVQKIIWNNLGDLDKRNILSLNSSTDLIKWKVLSSSTKIYIEPINLKELMRRFESLRLRYIELEGTVLAPEKVIKLHAQWNRPVQYLFNDILRTLRNERGKVVGTTNYWGGLYNLKHGGVPASKERFTLKLLSWTSNSAAQFDSLLINIEELHDIHQKIMPEYERIRGLFNVKQPHGDFCFNLKYVTPGNLTFG